MLQQFFGETMCSILVLAMMIACTFSAVHPTMSPTNNPTDIPTESQKKPSDQIFAGHEYDLTMSPNVLPTMDSTSSPARNPRFNFGGDDDGNGGDGSKNELPSLSPTANYNTLMPTTNPTMTTLITMISTEVNTTTTENMYTTDTTLSSSIIMSQTSPIAYESDGNSSDAKDSKWYIWIIIVAGVSALVVILLCAYKASKSKVKDDDHPSRFEFDEYYKTEVDSGIIARQERVVSSSNIEATESPISIQDDQNIHNVGLESFNTPGNLIDNEIQDLDVDNLEQKLDGDIVTKMEQDTVIVEDGDVTKSNVNDVSVPFAKLRTNLHDEGQF